VNHVVRTRRLASALVVLAASSLAAPSTATGQIVASERGRVEQTIDGTRIEIDYSRPSARGRDDLFGGVVPWGESWTPGANNSTKLVISRDVELEGVPVEAGAWGVWVEPVEDGPWRFGLHPDTSLFHTAHPPMSEATHVVEVEPDEGPEFVETLRFSFPEVRSDGATLHLDWGRTRLSLDVAVESSMVSTVPPEEGRALAGEWEFGTPGDDEAMPLVLRYDDATERVLGEWTQGSDDIPITMVRQAEGIYQLGFFIGDRIGSVIDVWYFEFFDYEDGRPRAFEVRDAGDEVRFEGRRTGR